MRKQYSFPCLGQAGSLPPQKVLKGFGYRNWWEKLCVGFPQTPGFQTLNLKLRVKNGGNGKSTWDDTGCLRSEVRKAKMSSLHFHCRPQGATSSPLPPLPQSLLHTVTNVPPG